MRTLWLLLLSLFTTTSPTSLISTPRLTPTPSITTVNFGLVGDLGLGRHITSTARLKDDFFWSFREVSPWLIARDFTLANLESPIIVKCPTGKTGTFTFCGDTRFLPQLVAHKLILNLHNNHILNYGLNGLQQTQELLKSQQIAYTYDKPHIFTQNGIKFGFVGFDFVTYPNLSQSSIIQAIQELDTQVDWLIVSLHWGNEYLPSPEAWRVKFAHEMVDAGADLIHGHHPHVYQPQEIYQEKPIFYSLGNFIFDQSWSYETSHTQIVDFTLNSDLTYSYKLLPVEIKYNSQPWLMP